ncbi:hypothetical protein [Rhizobium sp. BK251]|uniref:hypothetical protein n=1 Tax=Rhizobium sp. BK251 TaxID=2512125 RepID=UPI00104A2EF6|nr:hypothetical protein [Rhizobium sp. BK251]TCL69828.1 hypothetical protein EV286_108406 [Rhizobium sp. BK251]
MTDHSILFVALLAAYLVLILLLFLLGIRIFLLPLRLLSRLVTRSMRGLPTGVQVLIMLWTIVLSPGPFVYFWDWMVGLAKSVWRIVAGLPGLNDVLACGRESAAACVNKLGTIAGASLDTIYSSALDTFALPEGLGTAGVIFATSATVCLLFANSESIWRSYVPTRVNAGAVATLAALTISFAAALYLAILAIIAVPVFSQKQADVTSLAKQLNTELEPIRVKFSLYGPTARELGRDEFKSEAENAKKFDTLWTYQLSEWDRNMASLENALKSAQYEATSYQTNAVIFFQLSNEGRVGETVSQVHVKRIANSFNEWENTYRSNVQSCIGALKIDIDMIKNLKAALTSFSIENFGSATQPVRIERLTSTTSCSTTAPKASEFLPPRAGLADSLGPFGAAAAWLLKTENSELALITGLLGFGFFGALATSFIKEFAGTPGPEFPKLGFIVPAFIRGISAAVLVFLLAKGGTAVLTTDDVTLNAYAIFFACFVAAVFSEDVWDWARKKQAERLGNGNEPADNTSTPQTPPV